MTEALRGPSRSYQELPPGWRLLPLRQICRPVRGVAFSAGEAIPASSNGYIACLTTGSVQTEVKWETRRYIPEACVASVDQLLMPGDVLVSTANSKALVGKSCLIRSLPERATFGAFVTVLRPTSDVLPDFMAYVLRRRETLAFCYSASSNTTGISNLRVSDLLELEIPLPPLREQERLAGILNEQLAAVERARASTHAQFNDTERLATAYLREAFPTSGQPLPAGWRWVELGELGWLTDGDWILNADYAPSGVRLLQVGDVGVGRFVGKSSKYITMQRAKELGCTLLEAGDILISRMPDPIGRACVLPELGYPCITAVDVSIFRPSGAKADTGFLVAYFCSPDWLRRVLSKASGATRPRISRSNLESLSLPLPNMAEQKRIAGALGMQTATAEKARLGLEALQADISALPAALLRRAFSGGL